MQILPKTRLPITGIFDLQMVLNHPVLSSRIMTNTVFQSFGFHGSTCYCNRGGIFFLNIHASQCAGHPITYSTHILPFGSKHMSKYSTD
jgi:hypothetical protein